MDNPAHLQKIHEQEETILHMQTEIARLKNDLRESTAHAEEQAQRKIDYLKADVEQRDHQIEFKDRQIVEKDRNIRRKEKLIAILCVVIALFAIAAITILIYDKANPDLGWFRDLGAYIQDVAASVTTGSGGAANEMLKM